MELVCLVVVNPLALPFMQLTPKKCDVQMSIYFSMLKARPEWMRHAQKIWIMGYTGKSQHFFLIENLLLKRIIPATI